jgi:hypothetical protein
MEMGLSLIHPHWNRETKDCLTLRIFHSEEVYGEHRAREDPFRF